MDQAQEETAMTGAEPTVPDLGGADSGVGRRAVGDLVKGQLCLFGGMALCVVVRPEGLYANHGISYFGVQWETVSLYAIGLVGVATFTRRALRSAAFALPTPGRVRQIADGFALLVYGVILTPYPVSPVLSWLHRGFGSALFVLQLALAGRLVVWTRDSLAAAFLLIQLIGGILATGYVLRDEGYLVEAQLLFQLGFGVVVVRTVSLCLVGRSRPLHDAGPASM